jgi:hypothetical protein
MKNRAVPIIVRAVLLGALAGPFYAALAQTNGIGTTPNGAGNPATDNAGRDTGVSGAIEQKPLLSPAQRNMIYAKVSKDKSKSSPRDFTPVVGGDVPPMIELYTLPEDALAAVPEAKLYKYTIVENKVVVVDPTRMRVVDVIGPQPPQPVQSPQQ